MSQFQVQSVEPPVLFQSAYGPMYSVKMAGLLDGQIEPNASINVKDPSKAPSVGQTLDVLYTKDNFGVKLKKQPLAPPAATPIPAQIAPQPAFTPPATQSYPAREDPLARQGSIERQNALTNAVAYCTAKASHLDKAGAAKELTGKHIIEVATYFARFTAGKLELGEAEPLPTYEPDEEI